MTHSELVEGKNKRYRREFEVKIDLTSATDDDIKITIEELKEWTENTKGICHTWLENILDIIENR